MPLQTFKYAACGGTTVLVEIIVYYITYYFVFHGQNVAVGPLTLEPHTASFLVGFAFSFPVGFTLNKFIVFTSSVLRGRVQLFRYGLTVLGSVALNYFFLKLFVEMLEFDPTISKILATILVVIYSYFTQQYFSFSSKKNEEEIA
jgi:putative flippase GtrA